MATNWKYDPKTDKQLRNWFNDKNRREISKFKDFDDFKDWYDNQEKVCFYCELKEEECQEIIINGKLKSNRFPENGNVKRGRARGKWLEVDRKNPKGDYSRQNCVLACYFCNNDKSDVFTDKQYAEFTKNRLLFMKKLLSLD